MLVKYQGGPMKGKLEEVRMPLDRLQVRGYDPLEIKKVVHHSFDPYQTMEIKRGEYARSNKRLKNGATVYIWMGWVE